MSDEPRLPARATGNGPIDRLTLIDEAPAYPNDDPRKVHTHLIDSEGQAAIEHRRLFRPRH